MTCFYTLPTVSSRKNVVNLINLGEGALTCQGSFDVEGIPAVAMVATRVEGCCILLKCTYSDWFEQPGGWSLTIISICF